MVSVCLAGLHRFSLQATGADSSDAQRVDDLVEIARGAQVRE